MTKTDVQRRFDCIEMKTNIQRQIYTETRNMSVDELLYYFNGNKNPKAPHDEKATLEKSAAAIPSSRN